MEEVKSSSENAVPLEDVCIADVKEIEPWGIYEQTAWEYVRAMVEEEERHKLLHKNMTNRETIKNIYFNYRNRSVKMIMLPCVIAQNNNLHEFFTIFISGITGIPSGMSIHTMPNLKNVPPFRIVIDHYQSSQLGQVYHSYVYLWLPKDC